MLPRGCRRNPGCGRHRNGKGASVTDLEQVEALVASARERWGGVHILINNAGILRDKSFAKMTMDDFRLVVEVHLIGSANCTKAVGRRCASRPYGRILMTVLLDRLFGNFGQANYGAAKLGLAGFAKTLHLEGANTISASTASRPPPPTRMTEDIFPPEMIGAFIPGQSSPQPMLPRSEDAPQMLSSAAGCRCGPGLLHHAHARLRSAARKRRGRRRHWDRSRTAAARSCRNRGGAGDDDPETLQRR
jgi:NAD(P)-dependent dehydrogenase (short-subunit alcohol dehydrogenase family)